MHCDDKRMLHVLEEQIKESWKNLQESGFQNEEYLKELNESIVDYNAYKNALEIQ